MRSLFLCSLRTCFELTNKGLTTGAVQVVPASVRMLHGTVFIAQVVGFSLFPRGVGNGLTQRRFPSALAPLVADADPAVGHESSHHVSRALVEDNGQIAPFTAARVLGIVPISSFRVESVVITVGSFGVSPWDNHFDSWWWGWRNCERGR